MGPRERHREPDVTAAAPERPVTAASAAEKRPCAACRVMLPLADLEPVPTAAGLLRCKDEDACRQRYTPRRLARSVRTEKTS
jgi:hypothetical protein